jgi:hypothetical protein
LLLQSWVKNRDIDRFIENGRHFLAAPIPATFGAKLKNQQIMLDNTPVEYVDWSAIPNGSIDFVAALNILTYLRVPLQKALLTVLAEKLSKDGGILMNGSSLITGRTNFVFQGEFGGWVTQKALNDIGLCYSKEDELAENTRLLRKLPVKIF